PSAGAAGRSVLHARCGPAAPGRQSAWPPPTRPTVPPASAAANRDSRAPTARAAAASSKRCAMAPFWSPTYQQSWAGPTMHRAPTGLRWDSSRTASPPNPATACTCRDANRSTFLAAETGPIGDERRQNDGEPVQRQAMSLRNFFGRRRRGPEIVYAPERDGDADPGEVVWGWVPYEDDPAQGK